MKFTIALAQTDSIPGDSKTNIAKHIEFVHRARDGGADLIIFPELSLSGYSIKDLNWDLAFHVGEKERLGELLEESKNISIILGAVEESPEFGIHNSALFLAGNQATVAHRKMYLPTYGMFEEQRYFSPGKNVRALQSPFGKLGILICEDMWHLPLPYLLAQQGAWIIICLTASPTRLSSENKNLQVGQVNTENHQTYARLLSSYIVSVNRVGFEDGVNFWGGSEVIGPDGSVVVQAKLFDEDLVFAEIDDNEVRRARRFARHFLDDDPHLVQRELARILGTRDSF